MEEKFKEKVFWKDGYEGRVRGGIFYRSFDFNKFLGAVELDGKEVVGLNFIGNDVEILVKPDTLIQEVRNDS